MPTQTLKTPQDFRERAIECERLAAAALEPHARETLLYVAAQWRRMAEEDEARMEPNNRTGIVAPSG